MTNLKVYLFFLIALHAINVIGQDIGEWNVYSSYSTVNAISVSSENDVYASTLGGFFTVKDDQIESSFTTIDGLHRLDILESVFDSNNNQLILGYIDGIIDVFDVTTSSFKKIEDINRVQQFTSKQINDIDLFDDEIYISTDFGVVVFNSSNFLVTNSYLTIGDFPRGSSILDLQIIQDSIFVGTEFGIGKASLTDNLLNAQSWESIEVFNEDIPATISQILKFGNRLFVTKNDSLLEVINNNLVQVPGINPTNTVQMVFDVSSNKLVIAYESRVISIDDEFNIQILVNEQSLSITSINIENNKLYVGTLQNGLQIVDLVTFESSQYLPDGPYLNFFNNLSFKNGRLLSTSSTEFPSFDPFNPIRGFYVFEQNSWNNFNQETNAEMDQFNFDLAYTAYLGNEYAFIGGWGSGILIHELSENENSIFTSSNSTLSGLESNRDFVVIGGIYGDTNENLWATSFQSDFPLNYYVVQKDEWYHFPNIGISSTDLYYRLFIDSNNQKWISLIDFNNNGRGLLVLNTGSDPTDISDDRFVKLTDDNNSGNLPSNNVTTFIEDKNGEVWIGTERGIARFIFPSFITQSSNQSEINAQWLITEDTSATSRFLLRDINVTAMAVNEANQKWVGSENQGVWLLNEEGSRIETRLTTENSPLISNNILSITIDDLTGEVFIATDLGLVSVIDTPIGPVSKLDELKVYPNPFVHGVNDQIIIENLSASNDIKILGVDGSIVHSFESKGGRITWNGLDQNGNELASGVYFVIALSDNGEQKGIGKVVIIR